MGVLENALYKKGFLSEYQDQAFQPSMDTLLALSATAIDLRDVMSTPSFIDSLQTGTVQRTAVLEGDPRNRVLVDLAFNDSHEIISALITKHDRVQNNKKSVWEFYFSNLGSREPHVEQAAFYNTHGVPASLPGGEVTLEYARMIENVSDPSFTFKTLADLGITRVVSTYKCVAANPDSRHPFGPIGPIKNVIYAIRDLKGLNGGQPDRMIAGTPKDVTLGNYRLTDIGNHTSIYLNDTTGLEAYIDIFNSELETGFVIGSTPLITRSKDAGQPHTEIFTHAMPPVTAFLTQMNLATQAIQAAL